jgi:ElaB/YqjD/DUF883 family membrane-anchored ribosome-binding protein
MNPSTLPTSTENVSAMSDGIDHLASRVDRSVHEAQQLARDTMHSLTKQVGDLRDETTNAMSHAAQEAQDMAHRGLDRTRAAVAHARDSASGLRDQTARRVQADPMKAVLIAAAAGAATALLLQWVSHARQPR